MATMQHNSQNPTRVILAIAAKDITDGIRNMNTLIVVAVVLFMLIFYRYLSALDYDAGRPTLYVFDRGSSALVRGWKTNQLFSVHQTSSASILLAVVGEGLYPELGISIPADFEEQISKSSTVTVQGYTVYWLEQADIDQLTARFERLVAETSGTTAAVQVKIERLYPQPGAWGVGMTVGIGLVFTQVMIGISLIPHLMFEEKQFKTLDALLVSPAGPMQVTLGKALAGWFYGLMAGAVWLAINWTFFTCGWAAVAAVLICSPLIVCVGLIMGTLFENRQQYSVWAWVVALVLFVPLFLGLEISIFPDWLTATMHSLPSWTMFSITNHALTEQLDWGRFLTQGGLLILYLILLVSLEAWLLRRTDR